MQEALRMLAETGAVDSWGLLLMDGYQHLEMLGRDATSVRIVVASAPILSFPAYEVMNYELKYRGSIVGRIDV